MNFKSQMGILAWLYFLFVCLFSQMVAYCPNSLLTNFFFFIRRLTSSFESFGLLNDIFPCCSILYTGCPIFNFHLSDILYDVIFPS